MLMQLLPLAIAAATPLLLAVLGELLVERSGLINLGIEGMMLTAAMTAVLAAQATGSVFVGVLGGIAGAAATGVIFGIATIEKKADQIVTGTAINLLALGVTGFVYRGLQDSGVFFRNIPKLEAAPVPVLERIPLLGPMLFAQDAIVPLAWIVFPAVLAVFLWNSSFGLRLRACGENPAAVTASGSSVGLHRWLALAVEMVLAGIAGAYLSLALSNGFAENMVAGRGFIALAIVIFGRWRIAGSVTGAALFGIAAAAQYALQASNRGVPFHLLLALPYVITLAILCGVAGRVRAPEALGKTE
jgi:general nucleoside transport system permease protein